MTTKVNCPHDGNLVEVSPPRGSVKSVTADLGDGSSHERYHNRYFEVGCDEFGESFWVFYS